MLTARTIKRTEEAMRQMRENRTAQRARSDSGSVMDRDFQVGDRVETKLKPSRGRGTIIGLRPGTARVKWDERFPECWISKSVIRPISILDRLAEEELGEISS